MERWIDLIDFHARVQECQPTWRIASIRNRFVSLFVTARSWQDTLYAREEVKATFTGQYGRGLPPSLNPFTAKTTNESLTRYRKLENFHLDWVDQNFYLRTFLSSLSSKIDAFLHDFNGWILKVITFSMFITLKNNSRRFHSWIKI